MKTIIKKTIIWRGSITDLATDVADILTIDEADILIAELRRFQNTPILNDKYNGKGHKEV